MQFNLVCTSTAEVPKWVGVRNVRKKSAEDGQKIMILDRRREVLWGSIFPDIFWGKKMHKHSIKTSALKESICTTSVNYVY